MVCMWKILSGQHRALTPIDRIPLGRFGMLSTNPLSQTPEPSGKSSQESGGCFNSKQRTRSEMRSLKKHIRVCGKCPQTVGSCSVISIILTGGCVHLMLQGLQSHFHVFHITGIRSEYSEFFISKLKPLNLY